MLTLALATYPHTLLNFRIVLSGLVGAQLLAQNSSITYVPLGSSVGLLGPPLLRFTTIVLAVGGAGGTARTIVPCSGGRADEDVMSKSDPVSPPVEL